MAVTTEKPLGERPVCRLIHLDDDADQRTRVAASLQRLLPFGQVDLRSADDANTFETLLGGEPVDCVITDTRLGWTDAGEVLRLVREHSPGTGVVLYSGDDNAETAARLIDSGADDFLLKSPDAADRLSKSVETVVKQHRATQREKQTPPMFAAVPIGLWRSDIDGNLLDANPALRNLLGTGDQPANLFNTLDNADDYARLLRRLRADGHVVGFDTQLTRPDGRRRRVRIDATLLDDGATPLIEGSLTDITERERTRRMTALRAQHLRSVFERSSVGMSVTELPGQRLTEVNGRLAAMFGYTPDELLDKPLSILWHPDERAAVMTRLNHVAAHGPDEFDHEQRCVRKDGSVLWVQATGTIVRDADGHATHAIASIYDATARRAEDDRLRESTRDANLASAAKDRFLAQLSHELRTPLTPALTAAAVLSMDDRLPDDVRGDLETIRRNIELEARLIDDLLDLNRAVNGKLKLRLETFDLDALLREAVAICAEDAAGKRIQVRLDVEPDLGPVHADRTRLEQVVWNLLKNAIKFTPPGGRVDIDCTRVDGSIRLVVRDTGIGLEPQLLERIFGNFEQGQPAQTPDALPNNGLGLGLAVARSIVELHGGDIAAESDGPGTGSTFTVNLPAAHLHAAPVDDLRHDEQVIHGRLLLVEDHADTAAVLGKFLRRSGFVVRLAHSLADARAALADMDTAGERADVLLSDLDLPDGTGHDLVRDLARDLDDTTQPLAVAFSGHGHEDDIRASHAAGFDEHLTKPIPPDVLLNTIRRLLAARPTLQSAS